MSSARGTASRIRTLPLTSGDLLISPGVPAEAPDPFWRRFTWQFRSPLIAILVVELGFDAAECGPCARRLRAWRQVIAHRAGLHGQAGRQAISEAFPPR